MIVKKTALVLMLLFISVSAISSEVYFGGGVGQSHVDLNREYTNLNRSVGVSNGALETFVGVQLKNGVFTQFQYVYFADTDAYEGEYDYNFRSFSGALGYSIPLSRRFDLRPHLELVNTELEVENDGGVHVSKEDTYHLGVAVSVDFMVTEKFALYGLYRANNSDFGSSYSAFMGVKFSPDLRW